MKEGKKLRSRKVHQRKKKIIEERKRGDRYQEEGDVVNLSASVITVGIDAASSSYIYTYSRKGEVIEEEKTARVRKAPVSTGKNFQAKDPEKIC